MVKNDKYNFPSEIDIQVLLTLYSANRSNQEFYFKQQWLAIYYAITLYAALFSVFISIRVNSFPFFILGGIVFIYSTTIICILESSLCGTREADKKFWAIKQLRAIGKIFGEFDSSKSKTVFYIIIIFNIIGLVALLCFINFFSQ